MKLPKALLQQHCQKLGWAPPRFDKLPLGGGRLPNAALRYSVTLEPAPQGKVLLSSLAFTLPLQHGATTINMAGLLFACLLSMSAWLCAWLDPAFSMYPTSDLNHTSKVHTSNMCVNIVVMARLLVPFAVSQQCSWVAQGKKAKAAARPKTYALHEDEDGWEGIQEAQNAAATRALFQVTATLFPLPHSGVPHPTLAIHLHIVLHRPT